MTELKRWHTEPLDDFQEKQQQQKPKELVELINSNSQYPLYWELQERIASAGNTTTVEDVQWLKTVLESFDFYVTKILNTLHIRPWDYDYNIHKEYEAEYGTPPPLGLPIRSVMGRLMTYKEIRKYVRESSADEWFWRRPEPTPIWNIDCISGGYRNEKTRPFRNIMTGLHPEFPRRAYQVFYDKPWADCLHANLDPIHHWGVYIDQGTYYFKDDPVRILMACCAEQVGHTEGCWIALRDDTTALEGVTKPYLVFPYIFNKAWENISNNNAPPPSKDDIKSDVRLGTAFKDYDYYEGLHKRITANLDNAAKAIHEGYGKYIKILQNIIDTTEDDAKRETNPFETPAVLTSTQRESISYVIRLQHEFNAIQCLGTMDPPTMRDYVNKRIFKVDDMLKQFTSTKMAGLLLASTGERLKMLSTTQLETPPRLDAFIESIRKAVAQGDLKATDLGEISTVAVKVKSLIEQIEANKPLLDRIKDFNTRFEALGSDPKLIPQGFDWPGIVAAAKEYSDRVVTIEAKQQQINKSVRSLRTGPYEPVVDDLLQLPLLNPLSPSDANVKEFKTLMDVESLTREVTAYKPDLKPPTIKDIPINSVGSLVYASLVKAYEDIQTVKQTPLQTSQSSVLSPAISQANATFIAEYDTILKTLEKSEGLVQRRAALVRFVLRSLYPDNVKQSVLASLTVANAVARYDAASTKARADILGAVAKYNVVVDAEEKKYQAKQKQIQTDATKDLETFITAQTAPILTAAGVNQELKALLSVANKLEALDDWKQNYMEYNRKLETIEKNLVDSFAAGDEQKYVAAWNDGARPLMDAALALANAMKDLLDSLNTTGNEAEIEDILKELEAKSVTAKAAVETPEQTIARLERERLEKERLAREAEAKRLEQERLAREAEELKIATRSSIVDTAFDTWMNIPDLNRFVDKSFERIQGLSQLWNTVKSNVLSDDFKFLKEKQFIFSRMLGDDVLITRLLHNPTVTDEIAVKDMKTNMYVEGQNLDEIKNMWKLFKDALIHTGLTQQTTKFNALKNVMFVEQPTRVVKRDVSVQVATPKLPITFEKYEPNGFKGLITTKSLEWIENSCWIDTALMSLFSIPQTTVTKSIYDAKTIPTKRLQMTFLKSNKIIDLGCTEKDAQETHKKLIDDISYIQDPDTIPESHTCAVRPLWNEWCGPARVAIGAYAQPSDVFLNLAYFYPDSFSHDTSSNLMANIYANYVVPATSKPNHVWDISSNNNYIIDAASGGNRFDFSQNKSYQVGAIIYGLLEPNDLNFHHFIAHIKDFETGIWYHYDRNSSEKDLQMRKISLVEEYDMYSNNAPYEYFYDEAGKRKSRMEARVPFYFVFFSNDEVQRLQTERRLYKKSGGGSAPAPAPIPQSTPPPVDLYIYTSGMGDPWVKSRWEKSIKPWLDNNFKTLNLDITHYDGVFSSPDLLKFTPQEKAIAQYLKFPIEHVSDQDFGQLPNVAAQPIEFNTLEGVKQKRYVFLDFAHSLDTTDPENSNRYTYVAYPYIFGESTFPHLDIFSPFLLDTMTKRPKTYIERLIGNEYAINDTNITLENNSVIQVKAIEGVKTQIQYFYFLRIVRYFNLIELAKQLDLEGAKTKLKAAKIFTYDELNSAQSIIPKVVPTPAVPTPQGPAPQAVPTPQGPAPAVPTPNAGVLEISDITNEPVPYGNPLRIEELFNASKQVSQESYALLDKNWNDAKPIIEKLDEVRLEGLLHVWWALRNKSLSDEERQQRIVVGISRADLDLSIPQVVVTPQGPPPTVVTPTVVVTPQVLTPTVVTPAVVVTPQEEPLVLPNTGLELYGSPKNVQEFQEAFNNVQSRLGNRPELGLGLRFEDISGIANDRYRMTGLMHAWWGATQTNPNVEAQVRGISMANL